MSVPVGSGQVSSTDHTSKIINFLRKNYLKQTVNCNSKTDPN